MTHLGLPIGSALPKWVWVGREKSDPTRDPRGLGRTHADPYLSLKFIWDGL